MLDSQLNMPDNENEPDQHVHEGPRLQHKIGWFRHKSRQD